MIADGKCASEEDISLCACAKGYRLKPAVGFEGATCTGMSCENTMLSQPLSQIGF